MKASGPGIAGQFAQLAFPFSVTGQAPLNAAGIPAVELSFSGERLPHAGEQLDTARVGALGAAVLQTIDALESAPSMPSPSGYLALSGKIVPLWAVRMLVLALLLPVFASTVDAIARARRRGHSLRRWIAWVLAGAAPFVVGLAALLAIRLVGALQAPAGGVGGGEIPIGTRGTVILIVVAIVVAAAFYLLRPACVRVASQLGGGPAAAKRATSPAIDGAVVALSVVMCGVSLVLWIVNPFAAALLVPAMHLWLWLGNVHVHAHRLAVLALVAIGLVAPVLVVVHYALSLGLGPIALVWSGALYVAGGGMSVLAGLYWSVVLGALASAVVIAIRVAPAGADAGATPVTVRGPSTYAGPGSLGGTQSALRRW